MEVRMIRADPRKSVAREVQNKMRPRPATRAASLVSATPAGFHRVKRRSVNQKTALPKERPFAGPPCWRSLRKY